MSTRARGGEPTPSSMPPLRRLILLVGGLLETGPREMQQVRGGQRGEHRRGHPGCRRSEDCTGSESRGDQSITAALGLRHGRERRRRSLAERLGQLVLRHRRAALDVAALRLGVELVLRRTPGALARTLAAAFARGLVFQRLAAGTAAPSMSATNCTTGASPVWIRVGSGIPTSSGYGVCWSAPSIRRCFAKARAEPISMANWRHYWSSPEH